MGLDSTAEVPSGVQNFSVASNGHLFSNRRP